MTEQVFHHVSNTGDSTICQFYHNGAEYIVWLWLTDSGNPDRMCLSEVKNGSGDFYYPDNKVAVAAHGTKIADAGGAKAFLNNEFLPKVNEYLAAQGEPEIESFPEDANIVQQVLWLVENALEYVDGQIVLND